MNDAQKAALIERAKREKARRMSFGEANDSQNAIDVLESIESNGTIRPAEAAELERLRRQSGQIQDEIGRTEATYRGALQGGTFQQADELYGLFGGDKEAARTKTVKRKRSTPTNIAQAKPLAQSAPA